MLNQLFISNAQIVPATWKIPSAIARYDLTIWDGICHVETDPPAEPTPEPEPPTPEPNPEPLGEGGLKALQTEREQRKTAEKQLHELQVRLKAYEGIDPERAKEADRLAAELQERARVESELKARYEEESNQRTQHYQAELQRRDQALIGYHTDVLLEREFNNLNGFAGEFRKIASDLRSRIKVDSSQVKFDGSGRLIPESISIEVLDAKGQTLFVNGEKAELADLFKELMKSDRGFARHFKGNDNPGFNLNSTSDFSQHNPQVASLSAAERLKLQREANRSR